MKQIVLLLVVIFGVVNGKNIHFKSNGEDSDAVQESHFKENSNGHIRHLRRPRQSLYNHYNSYYDHFYGHRRDDFQKDYRFDQQEQLLSKILKQLDEISIYLKNSQSATPAPPQVLYIPYPYFVPQIQQKFQNLSNPIIPKFPNRAITLKDIYQNWGQAYDEGLYNDLGDEESENENSGDGSRPIDLTPIEPEGPTVKSPPVEHGSSQAGIPSLNIFSPTPNQPGRCKAAILVCCEDTTDEEKQECFSQYGCKKLYNFASTCHDTVIKRVISEFADAYGPMKKP